MKYFFINLPTSDNPSRGCTSVQVTAPNFIRIPYSIRKYPRDGN